MRKLTKKTLDQLASEMPLISQNVQNSMFGRAYYYDLNDGSFIACVGDSPEIRLIDSSTYPAALAASLGGITGNSNNLTGSVPFKSGNSQQRENVIRTIATEVGIGSSYLTVTNLNDSSLYGQYSNSQDMITINSYSKLFENGNYNDFYCLLKHEQYHSNNYIPDDSAYNEYNAYNYVNNEVPQFNYASDDYRQHSLDNEQYFGSLL